MEVVSFRFRGHSVVDPDRYRDADEVKRERARQDPVLLFAHQLTEAGIVDDGWLKETADEVKREVQEAVEFAEKSPEPKLEDLFEFSYATPVPNTPGAKRRLRLRNR